MTTLEWAFPFLLGFIFGGGVVFLFFKYIFSVLGRMAEKVEQKGGTDDSRS